MDPKEQPAARVVEMRNSLWCVDKAGKVGMIGEINGGDTAFHYARTPTEDDPSTLSPSAPVPLADLRIATADELPAHVRESLNDEQMKDIGYV